MTTKTEIQQHLCAALSAETDTLLTSRSFSRKVHSIEYKRQCKEGEQLLQMYFEFRPSSQPRADSRIYPWITVVLPKLNRVALDMVNHVSLLIGDPNITFSQPIDFVIPKERHIAWYTYGRESAFECVRAIRSSLETWV